MHIKTERESRHLPIFPGRLQPSIFGTTELNYCVRNGNRWNLGVIGTGYSLLVRIYTLKTEYQLLGQIEYLKICGQALDLLVHSS